MNEPGRVIALDVGSKRIGVAMCDTLRILPSPLTTISARPRPTALARIDALIRQNEVVELVVGLPLTLSGEIGPQALEIKRFVADLEQVVRVPIHLFDERLTSAEAERVMIDMGLKAEQRRARIDEMAATIILRDYLNSRRAPPTWDDE
ncbi:MAG: Holliday junction resolvase RuvX [Roseiflexaceae bacterium]|nr:Holliday junction resolvase RuvX [Roseiflexaceae bacterium]